MKIKENLFKSILAGICIGFGGCVYLSCENKIVGAFMFAMGLFIVLLNGYNLFTGKICYLLDNKNKNYVVLLILSILGNAIGAIVIGFLFSLVNKDAATLAYEICNKKLELNYLVVFVKGILCDVCIFLAVDTYIKQKSVIANFLFVPAFIICGFEHSIADIFYLAAAKIYSLKALLFIIVVLLGNTIGGIFLPLLIKLKGEKNA